MATIRKRGDEWKVQVRRLSFPNRSSPFNRQEEAKAWARAQELAMDRFGAGVRYIPPLFLTEPLSKSGGPRATRTPNLLIRSQMLYPIELWDRAKTIERKRTFEKARRV